MPYFQIACVKVYVWPDEAAMGCQAGVYEVQQGGDAMSLSWGKRWDVQNP